MEAVKLIPGGISVDDRGAIRFVNEAPFKDVKRMYMVENFSANTIRAWHGHLQETKYVYAVRGSAIVACVVVNADNPHQPTTQKPHRFILSAQQSSLLAIPAGHANGFRMLEPQSLLLFFSTSTLEESQADDYRFAWDTWGTEIWDVNNR